jgi:hypothetical protein
MKAAGVLFSAIMSAKAVLFCTPGLRPAGRGEAGIVSVAGAAIYEKAKCACEQI